MSSRRHFQIIMQEGGGGSSLPFPIITQEGGASARERVVRFVTRAGKQVTFVTKGTKVQQRRHRRLQQRQPKQRRQIGRGLVGDYFKSELDDVAGTLARTAVNEGLAEGKDLSRRGFRYVRDRLTRRQQQKQQAVLPTASSEQKSFTYDV